MNPEEKLNLKRLIDQSDCENNTESIKQLKHSTKIRDDIRTLENLKLSEHNLRKKDMSRFTELCQNKANFLFTYYTDIFNKVIKDEIDLGIMTQLLTVLKLIEDGKVDQHEGSVMVGKKLKELYIDSALKRGENLDKQYESEHIPPSVGREISWKQFKQMDFIKPEIN